MDVYKQDGTGIEKTLWYHENARGDTVAMSDASGNVVLRLAYSAYGEVYRINGNGQLETFTDYGSVVYCFQGRRFDEESGLYYFRNRYYDPIQGRFLSRDPMEYTDSMGLYESFGGNPLNKLDPSGKFCCCKTITITENPGVIATSTQFGYGFKAQVEVEGNINQCKISQDMVFLGRYYWKDGTLDSTWLSCQETYEYTKKHEAIDVGMVPDPHVKDNLKTVANKVEKEWPKNENYDVGEITNKELFAERPPVPTTSNQTTGIWIDTPGWAGLKTLPAEWFGSANIRITARITCKGTDGSYRMKTLVHFQEAVSENNVWKITSKKTW